MAVRIVQICGIWFWVAFLFFIVVVFHQTHALIPEQRGKAVHRQAKLPQQVPVLTPVKTSKVGLTAKQRMQRSETSWRSSVALRHQMAKQHPQNPKIPFFPAQRLDDFGRTPYTLWDFFPATYTCPHDFQRVGRLGDGGKWVCGMSLYEERPAIAAVSHQNQPPSKETIIYSFGVNDESTFEEGMLSRIPSAQIFAYDFSVNSFGPQLSPSYKSRAHFKKFGLGAIDELKQPNTQFYTLHTLMAQNNHSYIDILKIDIEGAEYTALDAFMDHCEHSGIMPVGQVMIELHLVDDKHVDFERFTKWWERLESFGMRPAWLEVNLMAVTMGQGKTDPRCVEYVWINHKDEKSILLQDA
ncbi:hypothetical protein BP6252_05735 [Coleophoma cylindrospora]|uniref:Methyltransferase domain-containing protein n=1 Tax=Coleophoma cylindrospora TaxID=1849047 RepID=A0A3D8RUB2_9HELO|nr:hypothetical protein BP6252_05735 [Coleophoma cylindrospora]